MKITLPSAGNGSVIASQQAVMRVQPEQQPVLAAEAQPSCVLHRLTRLTACGYALLVMTDAVLVGGGGAAVLALAGQRPRHTASHHDKHPEL